MNKFSALEYVRPSVETTEQQLQQQIEVLKNAKSYEEALGAFMKRQEILGHWRTMETLSSIRHDMNTLDPFYTAEKEYFNESSAKLSVVLKEFNEVFVHNAYRDEFEKEFGDLLFKQLEADIKTNDKCILEEKIQEGKLGTEYAMSAASCKTMFKGEECNFYGLLKHMLSLDRTERKEAMMAWSSLYASVAPDLEKQYIELCNIRRKEAEKLGFDSYIDMIYLVRHRFDYDAKDVENFRNAIAKYVVPVTAKLYDLQRKRLGLDTLQYYDEQVRFAQGNSRPYGTTQEKVDSARKLYSELSPETKEFFNFMCDHELFDLETRPGKHLGGYMTRLADYKAPFIFSNFNGTNQDIQVLTHEAGHAFEGYVAMRGQKLDEYTHSTADIQEVHSMGMEFFTEKWYDLFYTGNGGDYYRYEHLLDSFTNMCYLVSVDEFQHKVFEGPQPDAMGLRKIWKAIEEKYLPYRHYDGDAFLESGGFWMQKQHVFLYPFYYVDYALAMTCALQFYLRMRKDFEGTWKDYLRLCQLGGSLGYKDLLKAVNLKNPFEEETLKEVSEGVMEVLEEMEKKLGL